MPTGIVFDIQRFALHDGPGIRTTVFLKGCPLNCLWCHNPESINPKPQLSYNDEKCAQCGKCVKVCAVKAHSINNTQHQIDYEKCTACGKCVENCLHDALKMVGKTMTVDEVMEEVIKDKEYYAQSNGGLTISGGEPMRQFDFTLELLKSAKAASIHTCLDTCGFAPVDQFQKIIPLVDLFLYDYKETDLDSHKKLTGVSNELILSNFDFLLSENAKVILRCPLVPGVNDSDDHLKGIAKISAKYPQIEAIEIMPYHDMGRDKANRIGKKLKNNVLIATIDETKKIWIQKLKEFGCGKCQWG
jgi:glycyl-radical enzyme activating protein